MPTLTLVTALWLRSPMIKQQLRTQHLLCPTDWTSARVFPWLLLGEMACHLIFSFLFFSLLVDESEHNRSSLLHQKIMFKQRHPHLHSQSSATEAAKFEQSRTTWQCWIVWRMHWRWSTAENQKVSKDGQGMLNWFHWKSTWCTNHHDPSMCWSQVPVLEAASLEGFGDCFHCPVWSGRHGPPVRNV